jgi:hypothetical protein
VVDGRGGPLVAVAVDCCFAPSCLTTTTLRAAGAVDPAAAALDTFPVGDIMAFGERNAGERRPAFCITSGGM